MAKTKVDKKVNRIVKYINKQLKEDVFGDRFYLQQIKKCRGENGLQYYMYMLKDKVQPARDKIVSYGWLWGESQFLKSNLYEEVNNFIIESNFWELKRKGE